MKIVAIMIVRNERCVLPLAIGHLVHGLGVDQVLVADNGSCDGTAAILDRLARLDRRIRWTSAPGPFAQSELFSGLAADAHRGGATWILPTDADEFLWTGKPGLHFLEQSGDVGAWVVQVRNFVQWAGVGRDHIGAAEKMVFSARPIGEAEEARSLVEAGRIAFVQTKYPTKLILRAARDLVICHGNHGAYGVVGRFQPLSVARILHAPLRARDALDARAQRAERIPASAAPTDSWHLRRLPSADLDAEWRANSTRFGEIGPPERRRRLRPDLRLHHVTKRQRAFARSALDG